MLGRIVLENLVRGDFAGPVYPVTPDTVSVLGVRAYARVTDVPDPVDLAVVTVPAADVAGVVEQCRAKGVHGLAVMTAGFADAGPVGEEAQRQLVALARGAGMRVLGPNCLGLVNTDPAVRMNATAAPVVPPPGRIGFFCQSGALGIAILADAANRGAAIVTASLDPFRGYATGSTPGWRTPVLPIASDDDPAVHWHPRRGLTVAAPLRCPASGATEHDAATSGLAPGVRSIAGVEVLSVGVRYSVRCVRLPGVARRGVRCHRRLGHRESRTAAWRSRGRAPRPH